MSFRFLRSVFDFVEYVVQVVVLEEVVVISEREVVQVQAYYYCTSHRQCGSVFDNEVLRFHGAILHFYLLSIWMISL